MPLRSFHPGFVALALLPAAAHATTYTFPGTSPCDTGGLQHCVDSVADGSRIEIATATPIAEDISLYDRSLTLTSADGYSAAFGSGHWVSVTSSTIAGDLNVNVSRLGFTDGYVFANYNGGGTANYDFEHLSLVRAISDSANYIAVAANGGTLDATLVDNRVAGVPQSLNSGLIQLTSAGATLNATAYYNHVASTAAMAVPGAGIFVDVHASGSAGAGTVRLHGNEVRGGFFRSGIFVSEGLFSSTASSVTARVYNNVSICADAGSAGTGGSGIGFVVNNGSIDAQAINNTVSRCYYGISATQWSGGGASAAISGTVGNNLVVAHGGLEFTPALTGSLGNDYNLINASTNLATLGAHTITAPAQLVLDTQPRLASTSPAIDAADTALLGFGLLFNGLPTNDADGLRRIAGATSEADIGAYESGSVNFTHVAAADTIFGNASVIDDAALNGDPAAALIATPTFNAGLAAGVAYDHPFGAYYPVPNWALFNQDSANPMPPGAHFDVFVPASGSGSFVHVSSASSISGYATVVSDGSTDNLPDRIVLVTQNWTAGGAALYNPHAVGVFYGGDSKWHVANLDGGTMQQPLGFNLYAQQASPNAFRVTASSGNLDAGSALRLDHPLLDGAPCARPQVTRLLGAGPVSGNFDIYYAGGKWYIYGYGGIASGEQFHVLVDPAQVFACSDRIFASGFD
jgi:hypothetical protein